MKRLLVIRFSALGDVAIMVPVLRRVAEQYSDWDITMLSRSMCEPLFRDMPSNVHFVGADLKGRHHGRKGLELLLKELDYKSFDAVADMHLVLRSFYLSMRMLLLGKRVAWIHKAYLSKWLIVHGLMSKSNPLVPTYKRYQHAFNRLGFDVHISSKDIKKKVLRRKECTGIAPFAAHKGKIYPIDKMEEVVKLLSERLNGKETIYLFGAGDKEKAILEDWEKKYKGVVSLAGKYDMAEEIELMRSLRVMLTMDSANMHLASLAGTRVISIWGATHTALGFLGYGQSENDCIQRDLKCRPCSVFGKKPCKYGDYRCLDIKPEEIVDRLIGDL